MAGLAEFEYRLVIPSTGLPIPRIGERSRGASAFHPNAHAGYSLGVIVCTPWATIEGSDRSRTGCRAQGETGRVDFWTLSAAWPRKGGSC